MEAYSLRTDDIQVGERHRALSTDAVDRLAASMRDIGLRQPISVRVVDEMMVDGYLTAGVPILVAGAHRLAAAKALGWTHIDCIEVEDDPIAAELWEIAENLHRCDLSKEQRDAHIRRYAELLEKRRAEVIVTPLAQQSQRAVGRPKSITQEIADNTGLSRDTVRRAIKKENRRAIPVEAPEGPRDPEDAFYTWCKSMNRLYGSAPAEWRERWLDQIDTPIMDRVA